MSTALPKTRAFLVQYSRNADPTRGRLIGRVEHLKSGQSAKFTSEEEMTEFVVRILREAEQRRECGRNRNH